MSDEKSHNIQHSTFNTQHESNAFHLAPSSLHSCPLPLTSLPLRLLLVGDGPERSALVQQAKDMGLTDQVVFAGYQTDVAPFYDAMDLFVLPSRDEGLSVALLEAMSSGVPVAVTDVGANREVIEDRKCGILLPDDETGWADVIRRRMPLRPCSGQADDGLPCEALAKQGQQRNPLAERGRARVWEHYSLDATLDAYEVIYSNMVKRIR
jgi:glycosyltransferase involved in cell wall biosynthesis